MSSVLYPTKQNHPATRNSSLELLRIAAMMMIIGHHIYRHGNFDFPADVLSVNKLWVQFLLSTANIGNNIFVIISGYFLIKSSGVKWLKAFGLWVRAFFYAVSIYFLFVWAGMAEFDMKTALRVMCPVTRPANWFIATYFVMYLIHPYVNAMLHSFSREDYRKYLVSVFIFWSIIPMLTNSDFQGNPLISFICLYSLGGYIRLWADSFGDRKYIMYGALSALGNFFLMAVLEFAAMRIEPLRNFAAGHPLFVEYLFDMMRPLPVLSALFLFIGFKRVRINSRAINIAASATLGVYLIHENEFVRENFLWQDIFRMSSFTDSPYLIPYSLAAIIIVYISCTLIDLLRSKIFRALSRGRLS